jgi:NADH:ubiquinone oxidoreductase subunit K
MVAVIFVTTLALTEAILAVALVARFHSRGERSDICDGLCHWRV